MMTCTLCCYCEISERLFRTNFPHGIWNHLTNPRFHNSFHSLPPTVPANSLQLRYTTRRNTSLRDGRSDSVAGSDPLFRACLRAKTPSGVTGSLPATLIYAGSYLWLFL